MVEGDESFKRQGDVPFKWEIRPGVPNIRDPQPPDDPALLQPPNNLPPLRLKPFSSYLVSNFKNHLVSPFAPPSSFKLKPPVSHSSGPPAPYLSSSSRRAGLKSIAACFLSSLFGLKKIKSGDVKKKAQESENFNESESMFSRPSEDSSEESVSTTWGSPQLSFSSRRGASLKRSDSDSSSHEKKTIMMMACHRLN